MGVILEQRGSRITRPVLAFLTLGVTLDITSTILMILGSTHITIHGFIGWSALAVMLTDAVLVWRHRIAHKEGVVSRRLNLYTRYAYSWWVVAYIAGAVIAMTLK
jgi:hypothetical protein